jgi:hypothetical protein
MNMIDGTDAKTGFDTGYASRGAVGANLDDMLNVGALSRMIEDFCSVTGLMVDIIDRRSGEVVVAEGMKKICATFHRDCPASELSCKTAMDPQQGDNPSVSIMSHCELGLSTAFSTVTIGGKTVADIFVGPALLAPVTVDHMKTVSKGVGVDANTYHKMMEEVSVIGPEDLQMALSGLAEAVRMLAEGGVDEEARTLAAYKALFMAKRGFLKDAFCY